MTNSQKKMKDALIDWVSPVLMDRGFKGAFPNYRRTREGHMDILSFQASMFAGAFCVGIACCPSGGVTFRNGKTLPVDRVTANHCPKRLMLGTKEDETSHWFRFQANQHEQRIAEDTSSVCMYDNSMLKYKKIADVIVKLLDQQGEPWWESAEPWWENEVPVYNTLFFEIHGGSID